VQHHCDPHCVTARSYTVHSTRQQQQLIGFSIINVVVIIIASVLAVSPLSLSHSHTHTHTWCVTWRDDTLMCLMFVVDHCTALLRLLLLLLILLMMTMTISIEVFQFPMNYTRSQKAQLTQFLLALWLLTSGTLHQLARTKFGDSSFVVLVSSCWKVTQVDITCQNDVTGSLPSTVEPSLLQARRSGTLHRTVSETRLSPAAASGNYLRRTCSTVTQQTQRTRDAAWLRYINVLLTLTLTSGAQWRRQLVGTWARAPLAFERFFSLGYRLKQVVWFGLVLCQTLTQHYLFSRIRFWMTP